MPIRRLLLINYEYPPLGGGGGNATRELGRALARRDVEITVLTSHFAGQPREEQADGMTIRRVPAARRHLERSSPAQMLAYIASATRHAGTLVPAWRPDACIAFFGIPGGPVARALRRRFGIPYIVSLRGGDVPGHQPEQLAWQHRLTRPWIRRIWRDAAAVVANSEGLRRLALQTEPDLDIPIIPSGVDTHFFHPPTSDIGPPVAETAGKRSPGEPLRLLCVGRLTFEKGLQHLLPALAGLRDIDWRLDLVGDGPYARPLRRLVDRHGLHDRVTFAGWQPRERLVERYGAADIYVLPSLHEALPNTLLEAMACGAAVIATRVWGCEDLVEDGRSGLLVPPADGAALADAIRRLAGDPERRTRLAADARERVVKHFSWPTAADAYLRLAETTVPTG